MDVGFQHVGVHLDRQRGQGPGAGMEHLAPGRGHQAVNLLEQRGVHQANVVSQGLVMEDLGGIAPRVLG